LTINIDLKRSLEREIGLQEMKMKLAGEEIGEFERQYEMNSLKFLSRSEEMGILDVLSEVERIISKSI
jgi:hypothetical protein